MMMMHEVRMAGILKSLWEIHIYGQTLLKFCRNSSQYCCVPVGWNLLDLEHLQALCSQLIVYKNQISYSIYK